MPTRKPKKTQKAKGRRVRNLAAKPMSAADAAQVRGGGIGDAIRSAANAVYGETAKGMIQSIGR